MHFVWNYTFFLREEGGGGGRVNLLFKVLFYFILLIIIFLHVYVKKDITNVLTHPSPSPIYRRRPPPPPLKYNLNKVVLKLSTQQYGVYM